MTYFNKMNDRIAILTSSEGKDAVRITEFFSEGDRVHTGCIITDTPQSDIAEPLSRFGVELLSFPEYIWINEPSAIIEALKNRNIRLIVVDDLATPIPVALIEAFPDAVLVRDKIKTVEGNSLFSIYSLSPDGKKKILEAEEDLAENLWPRAIVETLQNLQHKNENVKANGREDVPPPTPDEEWASALHIPYNHIPEENNMEGADGVTQAVPPVQFQEVPVPPLQSPVNREPMPPTYLVWSILSLVLCCFIPSVVAIFYSARVSSLYYTGDIERARKASRNAEIWIIVAVVLGLVSATFSLPLSLLNPL